MRRRAFSTILVGPSLFVRAGLSQILSDADFKVVASGDRVQDLALRPHGVQNALLLVLDSWGSEAEEVGQIALFKQKCPAGRVAVIADKRDAERMTAAFLAGANAYFVRLVDAEAFVKGLELVMLGETLLPHELLTSRRPVPVPHSAMTTRSEIAERLPRMVTPAVAAPTAIAEASWATVNGNGARSDRLARLSSREECILHCLAEGASNKIIARKMNISEATVKVHVKAILRKLRVSNRTQAAIWALNNLPALTGSAKILHLPPRQGGLKDGLAG